jgi:exonuclease III
MDTRAVARGVFDDVLESESQVEDTLVYGNSLGDKLLEDHEALKAEFARAAAHRDRMTQGLAETNQKLARTEQDLTMWKERSTALEARQGVQGRIDGYLYSRCAGRELGRKASAKPIVGSC